MANKYALIGKLQAQPAQGKTLGEILLQAARLVENAPGCWLYLVNRQAEHPDSICVMEVWESQADHDQSLQLPGVRELISQAMPLLEGRPEGTTLEVLGGYGL